MKSPVGEHFFRPENRGFDEDAPILVIFATCERDTRMLGVGRHYPNVWGIYEQIRHNQIEEESATNWACYFRWKKKIPLKVQVFWWLLFRQRLVMHAFWKRMLLEALAECAMCTGVRKIVLPCFLSALSPGQYGPASRPHRWISHQQMPHRCEACTEGGLEEERGFAVLWALWMHHNEVIFYGKTA